jgi:hypothetical protein
VNESLVKYLAGLLDADGSLSFSFKRGQNREGRCYIGLQLRLTASDAIDRNGFVESLPMTTGLGSTSRYGERKQFVAWAVSKRADLEMLLPRLIKHMIIKAQHWQWLLGVWRETRVGSKTCSLKEREILTAASKESRRLRTGPVKPKKHPTWAWLAGYLDGDGWYTYRSGRYKSYRGRTYQQWSLQVGAVAHINDMAVLEFLKQAFGGIIKDHGQSENVMVWHRSLGYQNRSFALRFLPHVAKHSRLKRDKIDAIIHHHRQRLSVPGTEKRSCKIEDCDSPAHGHELCSKHYQRQRRLVQATV